MGALQILCGLIASLILAGCGGAVAGTSAPPPLSGTPTATAALHGPQECATGSLVALGSTALQPLVEAAAHAYMARCPDARINVQPHSATPGGRRQRRNPIQEIFTHHAASGS